MKKQHEPEVRFASMLPNSRVLLTGARGFLGKHVHQALVSRGANVFPVDRKNGYDLRNEPEALSAMLAVHPDVVVHLAATVGGIGANMDSPATFFRDNIIMGVNVIHATAVAGARLVTVGTACSYPKDGVEIPFKEKDFWFGYPEETNAPYGIAKKALLEMCRAYKMQHGLQYAYLIPTNLFGPGDNFDLRTSHVIPAITRKIVEAVDSGAREVHLWGTGVATRSFLYVGDAAEAIALACDGVGHDGPINLAGCPEVSVAEIAKMIAAQLHYDGKIVWDSSKPDGQPRRALDGSVAKEILGWKASTSLEKGLMDTIGWYLGTLKVKEQAVL